MAYTAGPGRPKGSPNKRTLALMEHLETGETPCAFGLRIMRDEDQPLDLRLQAAKLVAPYLHPKPLPETRKVSFALPETLDSPASLLALHRNLLRAVAQGNVSLEEAQDISSFVETHRKLIESLDFECRIKGLEQEISK